MGNVLALRKQEIRSIREEAEALSREQLVRRWAHDVIRLRERLYRAEHYDELLDLPVPELVAQVNQRAAAAHKTLVCARCGDDARGFRNKYNVAIYHVLGLCQNCQDAGPTTR